MSSGQRLPQRRLPHTAAECAAAARVDSTDQHPHDSTTCALNRRQLLPVKFSRATPCAQASHTAKPTMPGRLARNTQACRLAAARCADAFENGGPGLRASQARAAWFLKKWSICGSECKRNSALARPAPALTCCGGADASPPPRPLLGSSRAHLRELRRRQAARTASCF